MRADRFLTSGADVTLFADLAGSVKRQHASQVAGFVAVTLAAAVLMGWWAGLPLLSSWGLDLPAMRPLAALCLAALGVALIHPGKDSLLALVIGLAVASLALAGLTLVLFNVDLGAINRSLVPGAAIPRLGTATFRAVSAGTIGLGLAGGSLALSCFDRYRPAATAISGIVGAISAFALLGYLAGVDALYGSVLVDSPPLPAVVGLLCVAGAIVLRIGTLPTLRKPRPLWRLLVMLGCAIVAPLLLFGAYAGYRTGEAQLRDVREDLKMEARTLSANVDREIIGHMERLQALAASPSLRHGDFAEFRRQAEASLALRHRLPQPRLKDEVLSDPKQGAIVLVDRNMQQLVNTRLPIGEPLPKAGVPSRIARALATGEPQVTGLFMALPINQLLVTVIVPVTIDGENRYALAGSPDQYAIARVVAATELPVGWQAQAAVSDTEHRIIASSARAAESIGKQLPPDQRHDAEAGVFEFVDAEGRPSLQASAKSELTGWDTAVWAPKALLEAPVRAQWRTLGMTALLSMALVVALALWLGRIIAHAVGHAARAAIAAGEGGPPLPSATPVAEVNTLMAELGQTTNLLRESKDRVQLALDAAQLGSWQYDPLSGIVTGDARCQQIFDVATNAASIEDLLKPVHPDDAARLWAAIEAALDPVNPKRSAAEFRLRRSTGDIRWVEIVGLAYFEGAGSERRVVNLAGTAQDITERKAREEKEHLLMREINHRAKNLLSVVASIAHQTASRNPDEFVERFSDRIQALSANQDLLVRSEWSGVEIADLVRAQLAPFVDLIGTRILLQGPTLRLNPASAQAIGLALHELATNAAKYGALSTGKGRVDIFWGMTGETFTLSWTEREGPRVSAPQQRGFGSTVIEAMAERSVGGKVRLDYAPSGLTWRVTCPAGNALEWGAQATDIRSL
jgi:two-component sensor histidine kinase/PAS domain-containing protein